MKQIEVRFALVLCGGVSLAVYMNGVTREILSLVRASKRFRAVNRRRLRGAATPDPDSAPLDESDGWFALFDALSETVELRVVVDAISGASAGGVNGVMLARALAHDLPVDSHRALWLRNADVDRLTKSTSRLTRWAKFPVALLVERVMGRRLGLEPESDETRSKLRRFVQARWFEPPFSGERYASWLLEACDEMDKAMVPGESLLPRGHRLDLFATLTDYHGRRRRIALDDPGQIEEPEHRHILNFSAYRSVSGELISEFETKDIPALVFAARATSCFPGAFKPATARDIDRLLADRDRTWRGRDRFLEGKLAAERETPGSASRRVFIDGSVVMNKPFAPVIRALTERPANRQVARRIVYVDPNPEPRKSAPHAGDAPGFFRTILASLAHIPRNEPIGDDLAAIEAWNARARRIADVIAAASPCVELEVAAIVGADLDPTPNAEKIGEWRNRANQAARAGAGYAFVSYQQLKLAAVTDSVSALLRKLGGEAPGIGVDAGLSDRIRDWLDGQSSANGQKRMREAGAAASPHIVSYLRGLDVDFRVRRIRFVIRRVNQLYRLGETLLSSEIDGLKAALYEHVDRLARRWTPDRYEGKVGKVGKIGTFAAAVAAGASSDGIADAIEELKSAMALETFDLESDRIFAETALPRLPVEMRAALAQAYIGFAFYDLVVFPVLQWTDLAELNQILVDRISPEDSRGLRSERVALRGSAMQSFGAFFNRTWREHDYIWGRINAADRLLDILLSAVGPRHADALDVAKIRHKLFMSILDAEAPNLTADLGLIAGLRREVRKRFPN